MYGLKQNLWDCIKQYASISDEDVPEWKIEKVSQQLNQTSMGKIDDQLTVLTTPWQHQVFFTNCFQQAVHKIIIHTPFITSIREMLSEITPIQEIKSFFQANKILEIVYRTQDLNIKGFMEFMQATFFDYTHCMVWTPVQNLHKKSIIIDETVATSGSFNWFSSARDLEDDYMLMETTLVLEGMSAKWIQKQL